MQLTPAQLAIGRIETALGRIERALAGQGAATAAAPPPLADAALRAEVAAAITELDRIITGAQP